RSRPYHRVSDGQHGDHGALYFHRRIGAFPQAPARDLGVQCRLGQFLAAANGRSLHGRRLILGAGLPMKPSEYVLRQCVISDDPDEPGLDTVIDFIGDDNLVWNTDYPHPDAPDPNQVLPWFSAQPISEDSKRKILWDNAVRLYGSRLLE